MGAKDYLETLVLLDNSYLLAHKHGDACEECRQTAVHKDVAERMLRDDDFPAGDLAAAIRLHWDNYLFVLHHEGSK